VVFWVLGLCHLLGGYQRFKIHLFYIQGCLRAEAACSSEALVPRKPLYDSDQYLMSAMIVVIVSLGALSVVLILWEENGFEKFANCD
jgi:hypothetical protein